MKYYWILLIIMIVIIISLVLALILKKSIDYYHPKSNIRRCLKLYENQNKFCVPTPQTDKILAFRWDQAGFNNTRMAMEIVFGIALMYDRTIILPPPGMWAHIQGNHEVQDFYDIEALSTTFPIISSKDFFGKSISYDEYKKYFREHDGLTIPKKEKEKLNALSNDWRGIDSKAKNLNNARVWFLDMRMYGNVDKYFNNNNIILDLRKKIFDGFKFKPKMLDKVAHLLKKNGIHNVGSYNAVHYRAGDFKTFRPQFFRESKKNYVKKIKKIFNTKLPILIVTNEKDPKELLWLTDNFTTIIMDISKEPEKDKPLIDMIACTCAEKFIGTAHSSFTYYIQTLRGYMSRMMGKKIVDDEPYYFQGEKERENNVIRKSSEWGKSSKYGGWNHLDMDKWQTVDVPKEL